MKLYCISRQDRDHGWVCTWFALKAEAEGFWKTSGCKAGDLFQPVEVPTTRTGLVEFLNREANRDNG